MKGKILNKARMAAAVMAATAVVAASTAQADSLLAPLVINDTVFDTYFNFKMKGMDGAGEDPIHYTWIQKGTTAADMLNLATPCLITNNTGAGSKNDMIFQDVLGNSATPMGAHNDGSAPNGYNAGFFVGMAVIADVKNLDTTAAANPRAPEGDMSGFAYIVNTVTGDVQDYKLINNHRSAKEGDFSAVFTSKKSVDLAWMGSNQLAYFTDPGVPLLFPGVSPQTGWSVMVTGPDMAKDGGLFSGSYDASVTLSHNTRTENGVAAKPPQLSPQDIIGGRGVIDNDEKFTSGPVGTAVTCMGSFTRANLMGAQLLADTRFGGWTRLSISTTDGATGITPHRSTGALVYRSDAFVINGNPEITMQPETSGHLTVGRPHANRPF